MKNAGANRPPIAQTRRDILKSTAALAALAATIVAISWRQRWPSKVAVLAAASLLAPPYLFSYDAVMMIAPLGYFAASRSWKAVAIWVLMLEPLFARMGRYNYAPALISNLPNTLPIAAALSLFLLWKDRHEQLPESHQYGGPIPAPFFFTGAHGR